MTELFHRALHELFRIVELFEHEGDVHARLAREPFARAIHAVLPHKRQ
jgi:hypothetical protein